MSSTSAPLLLPTVVAFDGSGALFLAESNRHVIDRIDPSGVLTVYAGDGVQGFSGDGGAATSAELDSPQGLAVDSSGNLYIADTRNHRIRKVSAATGIISTIAGTGVSGFSGDQSQALTARFSFPGALAVDSANNLYLADGNNHRIRRLNLATGIVQTAAGNGVQGDAGDSGPALSASIDSPGGLAVDANGNLYLADMHNHRVRRVASGTGVITTVVGGGTALLASSATATRLLLPRGVSLDTAGNLYVADTQAHRVVKVSPDGTLVGVAGEGTQGFAGDGGPASAALLDSPRSEAVSPAGVLVVADTGNQRVRQLDASAVISSLSGVGNQAAPGLTLAGPSTQPYGSGSLTATLSSAATASGSVTFVDTASGSRVTLGDAPLNENRASLSTSNLPAGLHQILATYPGDATHASQQSAIRLLTITPAPLTAAPTSASVAYGQAIPAFSGSLTGLLPRDASLVSATFATTAQMLSPAGTYPIATTLSGPSAGNYQIQTLKPALLTITQASTATALTASNSVPVVFSARTLAATQGLPTGRITFFDTGASLGSATLNSWGAASFSAALMPGAHLVTAVYAGDANFLSSSSAAVSPVVSTSPGSVTDFTLTPSGSASQTSTAGSAATFPFSVAIVNGPLDSPILLTAAGMPVGATASFSPAYLPPGGASGSFTLTVQTTKTTAQWTLPSHPLWAILLWGSLALVPVSLRRKRGRSLLAVVALVGVLGSLTACGTTVSSNGKATPATAEYPLTVSATTTTSTGATLQHTAVVTLTLQ